MSKAWSWLRRRVVSLLGRLVLRGVWAVQRRRANKPVKRVLLPAAHVMALAYLDRFQQTLADDPRLRFTVTSYSRLPHTHRQIKRWSRERGLRYVPYQLSRVMRWDLIAIAEHHGAKAFNPSVPKVLINHSISGGKLEKNGLPYRYGRHHTHFPDGQSVYSKIFEASKEVYTQTVAQRPELGPIIAVVGDLCADELLALRSQREAIRRKLGFSDDQTVVLIQSTWGPTSLMETVGKALIEQAAALQNDSRYRFILSTHPHHWDGTGSVDTSYGRYLSQQAQRGFHVIRPQDDWRPYMAASDMAITDHTSLSVTYALLGNPMLFVANDAAGVIESMPVGQLMSFLPCLKGPDHLSQQIEAAIQQFPKERLAALAKQINAHPGEAAQRVRNETYQLLNLQPLTCSGLMVDTKALRQTDPRLLSFLSPFLITRLIKLGLWDIV